MSLVIPSDFINVFFGYQAEGDPELAYTAIGWELDTGSSPEDGFNIGTGLVQTWQLALKGVTSTKWFMTGSKVVIGGSAPPYISLDIDETTQGAGQTTSLPNNTAVLVKKVTLLSGRQGRGRCYVPGLDTNSTFTNGEMESVARGDWQEAIDDFLANAQSIPGLVSPRLFHEAGSVVTAPTLISGFVVDEQVATQRRRMRP